jgi:uncharacterized membrane protein YhaH (DUF805 family)
MGDMFKEYFSLKGRTRRRDYWMHQLGVLAGGFVFGVADTTGGAPQVFVLLSFLVSLVMIYYSFAIAVRRYHDVGKSGWNVLWSLVPFGIFVMFYHLAQPGNIGKNQYGPDPNEMKVQDPWGVER